MLSAILGILSSLPALISLAQQAWDYLNKISGNDPAGYLARLGVAFGKLNDAKSQEDHQAAAKALADVLSGKLTS